MKFLLPLLGLCALTTAAQAQDKGEAPSAGKVASSTKYARSASGAESGNTGFGVKGGFTLANLYGNGSDDFPNRNSLKTYHAGVYGQFGLSNFSSVQVEVLLNRKGYLTDFGSKQLDYRLDYISLPVLYVANITSTISLHVGPQVSLLANASVDGNDYPLKPNGFRSVDYGGVAGAEARIGPGRVGIRYDLSLGRVYDDGTKVNITAPTTSATLNNTNIRNQAFQVYVGIGFRR